MGPDGKAVRLFGSLQDITEQKQAEEAFRKSEAFLNETGQMARVGGWEIDLVNNTVMWTKATRAIHEVPEDYVPTVDAAIEFFAPEIRPALTEAIRQALEEGIPYDMEMPFITATGRRLWTRAIGKPEFRDGKCVRLYGFFQDITDRKRGEKALRASEERFRSITEQTSDVIALTDNAGVITYVSPSCKQVFAAEPEEMVGRRFTEFLDDSAVATAMAAFQQSIAKGVRSRNLELLMKRRDSTLFYGELNGSLYSTGGASGTLVLIRDISDRKQAEEEKRRLEDQFRQAQKMESVGRLAGGVAHDFNNILQSILGYADLALMKMDKDHPIYADLQEVRNAAKRSRNIIRQLLAFARKQLIEPEVLDLNDQVGGMLKMLRRLIGEDVNLAWLPGADVWEVRMDPSQIDQILVNLVVNARDAIEDVGQVSIETANVVLDEAFCAAHSESVPGPYVKLSVSDTGCGMDRETLKNIFDPFFTTKEVGKGTGLGLATVYGIVRQNKGYIEVQSEPGKGASFHIYLPWHEVQPKEDEAAAAVSAEPARGTETVLLVEDGQSVLESSRRMLTALGYTVLPAGTPEEALRESEAYSGDIHLLLTDVVMPGMNGRDLADRIRQTRPTIRSLYMSGYTADIIARQGVLEKGVQFIQKPFSLDQLARKVREAIGQ